MTNLEQRTRVKKYLNRYVDLKKEIGLLDCEIMRISEKLYIPKAQNYDDMPKSTDAENVWDQLASKVDAENRLNDLIKASQVAREEIEALIEKLDNDKLKMILRSIYIYGNTLGDTAYHLGYNYRYILQLHRKAIDIMIMENFI